METRESSCVPRVAKPFFIPVVHSPLGAVGQVLALELPSQKGRAPSMQPHPHPCTCAMRARLRTCGRALMELKVRKLETSMAGPLGGAGGRSSNDHH
jgi:hypothetical protein